MLEFYLCRDEIESPPENPERRDLLGGLCHEGFERLRPLWDACAEQRLVVRYFDDQRFTAGEVAVMAAICQHCPRIDYDRAAILTMLEGARALNAGIATYCD